MDNLEDIIVSSIENAVTPPEPSEPEVDLSSPEPIDPSPSSSESEVPESPEVSPEVPDPGPSVNKLEAPKPVDDFEKKFGIPAQSSSGRENRIPYSRVKKITEKAVKDALDAKAKEYETGFTPASKYQELEATAKDYAARLSQVAEFEQVMLNDAPRFLEMLSGIPAYARIFKGLIDQAQGNIQPSRGSSQPQAQAPVPEVPSEEMPQPDQQLSDGSSVYSMEGLKALLAWQAKQVETRVTKNVEQRYAPLETDYKRYQETQAVLPQVEAQIADARTWPLFNENEDAIVKVLNQYPQASLERAYQYVVWPKIKAEQDRLKAEIDTKAGEAKVSREAVRAEVLAELKRAPKSTSVAGGGASKPSSVGSQSGPRNLEEVIQESLKRLK